jgi:uncharacterized membrane protein YvlD (DUF360 family)
MRDDRAAAGGRSRYKSVRVQSSRLVLKLLLRGVVTWVIEAGALAVIDRALPGVYISDWQSGFVAVLVIGALNALVRPVIILLAANLGLALFAVFALLLNVVSVLIASRLLPGFQVDSVFSAFLVAFGLAVLNTLVSGVLGINDDDSFYRNVIRWLERRRAPASDLDEPGAVLVQIDGLSEPIIRAEITAGRLPTLARWLTEGTHRLCRWECDVPSMTSSGQSGILYGNNANIPAFRWFEKTTGRLMVSNHPRDARVIDERQATDHGLLRDQGSSVGNILSGSAQHCVITMSRLMSQSGQITARTRDLYDYFVNPYNLYRALGAMLWEMCVEVWEAWRQRMRGIEPRMRRGGVYPLVRAITTVLLRDITTWTLVADMFSGKRVAYADYLGYDEVAHHSGPATVDALRVLRKLDSQLRQLESAARSAPRQYRLVVLSDHGQSSGPTFRQRYGLTLDQVVHRLIEHDHNVQLASGTGEGLALSHALTAEIAGVGGAVGGLGRKVMHLFARSHTSMSGPAAEHMRVEVADVVVCASGNLGLIYFANRPGRLSMEALTSAYPDVVDGLVRHPGVGFVLVESDATGGPVVLGRNGRRDLTSGVVSGDDPLSGFSEQTAAFLRRLSSYPNVGDIVVNSLYDAQTGQVAAFEELIGCHGGAGGLQTSPFVLYPSEWQEPSAIVGSEQLHHFLSQHLVSARQISAGPAAT